MSSNKSKEKKDALARAARVNRRMPIFVIARTNSRVSRNRQSRNWLQKKMKLKVK